MEMWFGISSVDEEIEEETEDMVMNRRPPPPPALSYEYITRQIQGVQRQYEDWVVRMESSIFSEDDPRYISNVHMSEKSKERLAEITRKKKEEEDRNMKMWGRKDDPRLDPTSEFYDPLKLVHKDIENE